VLSVAVTVRRAERRDLPTLLRLIEALAEFEKLDPPDEAARARLQRDGWPESGEKPRFQAWLAEAETEPSEGTHAVGYAITFETYSTFLARPTLYIEDIFVLPSHRRQAVGSALMERLVAEAKRTDCGRMEWVVLDWNTGAQEFYRRWGAGHLTDWQVYRLRFDEDV
jgi:GNAT superfamily N-acetyltransferase